MDFGSSLVGPTRFAVAKVEECELENKNLGGWRAELLDFFEHGCFEASRLAIAELGSRVVLFSDIFVAISHPRGILTGSPKGPQFAFGKT